ncbi:MAG: IS3 family transposase, partial [Synergistaceae bacterium]|nr:IS3 family transposase [Synergistaceae bacterium]
KEEINRRKFSQIEEVKQSVFSYIEGYYNKKRPHSTNGGLSPDEREAGFWTKRSNFLFILLFVPTLLTIIHSCRPPQALKSSIYGQVCQLSNKARRHHEANKFYL